MSTSFLDESEAPGCSIISEAAPPMDAGGVGAVTGGARSNAGMTTGVVAALAASGGGMYDFD